MKCIYCKQNRSNADFSDREHVIPESFGSFQGNLVLHGKVCDECNSHFGKTLDIRLARDTYEGLYRYSAGIKKPNDFKHLGQRSTLIIKIGEGLFKNAFAFMEYSKESKRLELRPLEQIGLKKRGSEEYDFFTFEEFPSAEEIDRDVYDLKAQKSLIVLSERLEEATKLLQSIGVAFSQGPSFSTNRSSTDDVLLEVTSTVDDTVRRALAKIAFNYLSYWNKTEILLHKAFDPLRSFVMYGTKPQIPLVHFDDTPILADEPRQGYVREGHIVTVEWNAYHDAILSKLSLFNNLMYKVLLTVGLNDVPITVYKGHFWNIASMSVLELQISPQSGTR